MAKTINSLTLLALFVCCALVTSVYGGNNYLWGEIGPNDYHLAKDVVSKSYFIGLVQKDKYVFKQKNNLDALTITAIKITDKKKKNGATAVLTAGGPGSKGATIVFTSKRGSGIKDLVEIWGR